MAYQPRRSHSGSHGGSPLAVPRGASGSDEGSPLVPGADGSRRSLEMTMSPGGSPASPGSPERGDRPMLPDASPRSIDELFQIDDDDEEDPHHYGTVPLLGDEKMLLDDEDATYVIIFPRQKDKYGDGTVNPNAMRENPRAAWEQIFRNVASKREKFPSALKRGPMREAEYQELVRMKLLTIFRESGFKAVAIESIDKDEVFLKVALQKDGDMVRKLAEAFGYRMPFKRECYEAEEMIGHYPGRRPMMNSDGVEVFAYEEYRDHLKSFLQPFRGVDEVRLITLQLDSLVNMRALQKQNIISRHFPGADYETVMRLNSEWADWQNVFLVPSLQKEDLIRNYFGEEIAFFFRWLGIYIRMLGMVALVGGAAALRSLPDLGVSVAGRDAVKIMFGFMMVMWEAYLLKVNKASSARAEQAWGMDGFDRSEPALPSYDRNLEGTQGLKIRNAIGAVAVIIYMMFFISLIGYVNYWFYWATISGNSRYAAWQPYVQSILIKVLSFVWRKISYYIVMLQNHRTQTRFNDALIMNLSMVKLFVALWPFFYLAAVKSSVELTCEDSLSLAAHKIYRHTGWPAGLNQTVIGSVAGSDDFIPLTGLEFLQGYWHIKGSRTCIEGCYPAKCIEEQGKQYCTTNCLIALQDSLRTLYIVQVGSSMVFMLIPILMTWQAAAEEKKKAKKSPDGKKPTYSFIQLQAKCHQVAPYDFQQWGGSYVEDFLDIAVGYALLACFGMCYPSMSMIGFVCMMIQYRLLAYRMTNVTCRPDPRGSAGIGLFGEVFEVINILSVFFNVLLAVFVLLPARTYPFVYQLVVFIIAEKGLFLLRGLLEFMIPDIPAEVTLIEDFNNEFKKTLGKRKVALASEAQDYSDVDIGLHDKDDDKSHSSSESDGTAPAQKWRCIRWLLRYI